MEKWPFIDNLSLTKTADTKEISFSNIYDRMTNRIMLMGRKNFR